MKILGISGLPGVQEAKNKEHDHWSGSYQSRVCQGLDSAAAIVIDGIIVCAIAEERLNGEKGTGAFPALAIRECMRIAGIHDISEFDGIYHGFDYRNRPVPSPKALHLPASLIYEFLKEFGVDVSHKFFPVRHHLAHAYSAVHTSSFDRCLCVIADGMGEIESLSVYSFDDGVLERLAAYPIKSSLGIIYSIFTRYLGFEFNMDEYKVMGMTAYGSDEYSSLMSSIISYENGQLRARIQGAPSVDPEYRETIKIIAEIFKIPAVVAKSTLLKEHYDVAHSLQKAIENTIMALVDDWLANTNHRNVCLAGGVFLNCLVNQKVSNSPAVKDVYVQPASGDDGTALGAALYGALSCGDSIQRANRFSPYLGPSYDDVEDITRIASGYGLAVELLDDDTRRVAESIAQGRVIAWFDGRMEFGPRALGARSILANPCDPGIKDKINRSVKFRELFRPFAPALLIDDALQYFDFKLTSASYYMLQTANARDGALNILPGVIHADGTARIQIVDQNLNKKFFELVSNMKGLTGVGCVLNTSFNLKGQPLICSPKTAIETFIKSEIDELYICGLVLKKRG